MAAKRIQERTVTNALEGAGANNIDTEQGVIRDVVICGFESANNRRYPPEVLRRDHKKYEGCRVNFNHSNEPGGRLFEDGAGWLSNVRSGSDGRPRGDLYLYLSDPRNSKVLEAAKRNPNGFGLSHVAMCHTRYEGGIEVVESIETVESVDIVSDPATVAGIFESKAAKGNRVAFKVKQLVEWVVKHPKSTTKQIVKIKALAEEDSGMYAGADMAGTPDAGPDASTDPDDAISSGFEAALMAVVRKALSGDMDPKAALQKIKTLLAAHCDATDSGGGDDEGDDEGGDDAADADKPASEGKRKGNAIAEAMTLCDKLEFRPDGTDLNIVAGSPKDLRERIVERLKKGAESGGGERPKSNGRHQTAILEEQAAAGKPPSGGKDFAKWVTE